MAIVETLTDTSKFFHWMKQSDSYNNQFTYEGANAVQDYYEQLSEDLGEDIEFDPIAWCCEWAEYNSITEAMNDYKQDGDDELSKAEMLAWFEDKTTVIELDNGHVLVQEF